MTTMLAHSRLTPRPCTLSPGDLARMARTFDESPQAVWIHDLSGRCVYRNPTASRTTSCDSADSVHELLDHHDRRIGRLRLRMG